MPRAKLTLTLPDGVWIGDVSRAFPETTFRILAAVADDETGVGLVEVTTDRPDEVEATLRDVDDVSDLEVLKKAEGTLLVEFETTAPLLLLPVQGSGVPLEMPFDLRDGQAEWEVTAPQDRLSELGEQLEEFGIRFRVDYVRQSIPDEDLLTDAQLDLVREAVDRGYYDTPRECSLTELAEARDMAKSTCSETLHRAEEKIVKAYLSGRADVDLERTTA